MKTAYFKLTPSSIGLAIFLTFILTSCILTPKIYEKHDIVYSTKRFELQFNYPNHNERTPVINMQQSIIKEISKTETTYKVYDVLVLKSLSHKVEEKVFLIIDREVFPMKLESIEYENTKNLVEKTENIETSDSTSISVITGYSENNRKITRFSYKLPDEVIPKIQNAKKVYFRYYSGPDMLTMTLEMNKLNKLKQLINKK